MVASVRMTATLTPIVIEARDKVSEDVTTAIVKACVEVLSKVEDFSASDILAPMVCVTDVVNVHKQLLQSYSNDGNLDETFPRDNDTSFIAGLLWLHLRRRKIPLIPFEFFPKLVSLVTQRFPAPSDESAQMEEYVDMVRSNLDIKAIQALMNEIPQPNKTALRLILDLAHRLIEGSKVLTSLGVANIITPILAKPSNTAYLSIRHRQGNQSVRLVLSKILDQYPELDLDENRTLQRSSIHSSTSLNTKHPNENYEELDPLQPIASRMSSTTAHLPQTPTRMVEVGSQLGLSKTESSKIETESPNLSKLCIRGSLSVQIGEGDVYLNGWNPDTGPKYELFNELVVASVEDFCNGGTSWLSFARRAAIEVDDHVISSSAAPNLDEAPQSVEETTKINELNEEVSFSNTQSISNSQIPEESMPEPMVDEADNIEREGNQQEELKVFPKSCLLRSSSEGRINQSKFSDENLLGKRLDKVLQVHLVSNNQEENSDELIAASSSKLEHSGDEMMGLDESSQWDRHPEEQKHETILADLEQQKKALKKRLKKFDDDFEQNNGRKPGRKEKEPIRPLYEEYSAIKQKIIQCREVANQSRKRGAPWSPAGSSASAMLQEKRVLQAKLRDFERDFEQKHGRKIRYGIDIKGHENDYRRYKELKTKLASLSIASPSSQATASPKFGKVNKRRARVHRW